MRPFWSRGKCKRIKCSECELTSEECDRNRFGKCVEKYHDGCKHREIIDVPFSRDWCKLKNNYCDNIKPHD